MFLPHWGCLGHCGTTPSGRNRSCGSFPQSWDDVPYSCKWAHCFVWPLAICALYTQTMIRIFSINALFVACNNVYCKWESVLKCSNPIEVKDFSTLQLRIFLVSCFAMLGVRLLTCDAQHHAELHNVHLSHQCDNVSEKCKWQSPGEVWQHQYAIKFLTR